MRILIVKLGSIGDIVHTLPTLAAVKRAIPQAEVSWVVERRSAEVLKENPLLHRLIEVDTKALRQAHRYTDKLTALNQQLRDLRSSSFDVAIDFQGLFKSSMIALLSGAPRRYGFSRKASREPLSRLLLTKTIKVPLRVHVIEKNLALAAGVPAIAISTDHTNLEFPIAVAPQHEREAEAAALNVKNEFAILNPGGGWPTKLWNPERYGKLADRLWSQHNLRSLITYGPGESSTARAIVEASRSGAAQVNLSLKGFYALARRARVYVGGDTGPTHLAVAASAPVVGIFGPTEWWRNGSPRAEDLCVERIDIGCRTNCHRRACSKWVCMDIEVERVLEAVTERLERAATKTQPAESWIEA